MALKYGGCQLSDTIHVIVIDNHSLYVPNAFTPNSDGINDTFMAYGREITFFDMKIFNRWGEKIFESDDEGRGWDGTYKGEM